MGKEEAFWTGLPLLGQLLKAAVILHDIYKCVHLRGYQDALSDTLKGRKREKKGESSICKSFIIVSMT